MIYLVAGIARSGTSMMMHCLKAGGLNPLYRKGIMRIKPYSDYDPNPNGSYQFDERIFKTDPDFANKLDGRLVKLHRPQSLPEYKGIGDMKIVIITRNFDEIVKSRLRTFAPRSLALHRITSLDQYKNLVAGWKDSFKERGWDFVEVTYAQAIEDAKSLFTRLKDDSWPIDVAAAASKVDISLYRHRVAHV